MFVTASNRCTGTCRAPSIVNRLRGWSAYVGNVPKSTRLPVRMVGTARNVSLSVLEALRNQVLVCARPSESRIAGAVDRAVAAHDRACRELVEDDHDEWRLQLGNRDLAELDSRAVADHQLRRRTDEQEHHDERCDWPRRGRRRRAEPRGNATRRARCPAARSTASAVAASIPSTPSVRSQRKGERERQDADHDGEGDRTERRSADVPTAVMAIPTSGGTKATRRPNATICVVV